ncbi:30S ribosomal protein S7 [Patescibacteria group bacterium]|nr:MAG: 30S ribosomal protein S7 [Patescibacteria group bacterium]
MRGKPAKKRELPPDAKYGSPVVTKFINYVMQDGKKTIAQKIVYGAFDILAKKSEKDPLDVFEEAINNASPIVEVRSRRVGGANYQVPVEVRGDRRLALAFRWLITAAQDKKGKPMREKLSEEILLASKNEGSAVKKKADVHRMAESNRAFAHFSR